MRNINYKQKNQNNLNIDTTNFLDIQYKESKHLQSSRYSKFIPRQFKNKHSNDSLVKQFHSKKSQKASLQFMPAPFGKKYQMYAPKRYLESNSQKKLQQYDHKSEFKQIQKKNSNQSVDQYLFKFRETNSTQCQTPKGSSTSQYSRLKQWKVIGQLGKGRYGEVFLVRHIMTGFIAALKVINKDSLKYQSEEEANRAINQLVSEIKIQSFLSHPNIISIYDFFCDEDNVYLVLQLATDGHLYGEDSHRKPLSQQATSILVREITQGINYMHRKFVIHRDVKLQNIVLTFGMVKICDFGWAAYCPKEFRSTLCGTPLYLSPEMLLGKEYNSKIDIWAIGSITHELITSKDPFRIKKKEDLQKIISQDFQMQIGSPQLKSFINFILRKNPSKRPDAQTVLRHPFIQKYKDLETSLEICEIRVKR